MTFLVDIETLKSVIAEFTLEVLFISFSILNIMILFHITVEENENISYYSI